MFSNRVSILSQLGNFSLTKEEGRRIISDGFHLILRVSLWFPRLEPGNALGGGSRLQHEFEGGASIAAFLASGKEREMKTTLNT